MKMLIRSARLNHSDYTNSRISYAKVLVFYQNGHCTICYLVYFNTKVPKIYTMCPI